MTKITLTGSNMILVAALLIHKVTEANKFGTTGFRDQSGESSAIIVLWHGPSVDR